MKDYRRGIYLIPNLLTTGNLFSGFYAIVSVFNADYLNAAIAILVAMAFDVLDGKSARLTKTTSRFGVEYDSLADVVSFGVAPGLLIYSWALSNYGRIGWVAAFLFLACGTLRLARFNVQVGVADKRYFRGLPSPAAAALVIGLIWVLHSAGVPGKEISILALLVTVAAGVLMVSNIRYRSFKDLDLRGRVPFMTILAVPLLFVLVFLDPPQVLFLIFLGYGLSGPLTVVFRSLRGAEGRHVEKHR